MSLRTRLPLGAGQAPWTREWGQGPCPEFLRSLGPTRAQRLAMEGARSALSRWLHSLVQGLFKAESHLAKGLGFSRFPPKSWFVWGSGSWHKNASDHQLRVSFLPSQPPNAPALALSQTDDSPHELADSRVSCGVLLRTRAQGVCFQIITGQLDWLWSPVRSLGRGDGRERP